MSYTTTSFLGLKLIDYDTEDNTWGTLTNQNWSDVDAWAQNISVGRTLLYESQPSGTNAGSFFNSAWRTRTLNSIENAVSWCTLASNQFTLDPGTYFISALTPCYEVGDNKARLYDPINLLNVAIGLNAMAVNTYGGFSYAVIKTIITLASSTTLELQHRCSITRNTDGFGRACNFGVNEIYSQVEINLLT